MICLSDEFRDIIGNKPQLRLLRDGFQFLEGPTWYPAANGLVFSDIPADTMYLWRPDHGCSQFRKPSSQANGNTLDTQGRLLTCEHRSRRVTRTETDGSITILAEVYNGKRLNSPNDITVQRNGDIWFTDPPYGIRPEEEEQPSRYVFRLQPNGQLSAIFSDFIKPNGIALAPDQKTLYVSDTDNDRHHIRAFTLGPDGVPGAGEVFRIISPGKSDGFRTDRAGRIYTSAGDGIWVLAANGSLLGKIPVPEIPANCAFGGPRGQTLFITARTGLYAIDLNTRGDSPCDGLWE